MSLAGVGVDFLTALVLIGLGAVYEIGALKRAGAARSIASRRHLAFGLGLLLLLVSFEPPFVNS